MKTNKKTLSDFQANMKMVLEDTICSVCKQQIYAGSLIVWDKDYQIVCSHQCWNKNIARRNRNAQRRAENQVLRELCGTSARAAREDMGLSKS